MILEILPVHPACEQEPANRVLPFDILICLPSLIRPYVLHFKQNPSIVDMEITRWRHQIYSLAQRYGKMLLLPPTWRAEFWNY